LDRRELQHHVPRLELKKLEFQKIRYEDAKRDRDFKPQYERHLRKETDDYGDGMNENDGRSTRIKGYSAPEQVLVAWTATIMRTLAPTPMPTMMKNKRMRH
jgi:hypothetical protein